jgi:hypothetical protein
MLVSYSEYLELSIEAFIAKILQFGDTLRRIFFGIDVIHLLLDGPRLKDVWSLRKAIDSVNQPTAASEAERSY